MGEAGIFSLRIGKCVLAAALLLAYTVGAQAASFHIVYNTPAGQDEKDARAFILDEGVTGTVSRLLNGEFTLRGDLTLYLGGNRGPAFDAASNSIYMPYSFVFDIADRFRHSPYSRTGVDIYDVTRDTYLFVLLHEVSHALFVMYDLRTTGDPEQAINAMTTLLLLRYYQGGGDIVLHAAGLFLGESDSGGNRPESGFWEEHQFDRRSYDQAVCLVYGSNPKRYAGLKDRLKFLEAGGPRCIQGYQRQNEAWFAVLGQFLKRPPPG